MKRQLKEDHDKDKQSKHDNIFNLAFAIFGAFGVASSVVDILISDPICQSISLGSMILYLSVVIFSYKSIKNNPS